MKISVITVTYNCEDTLAKTMESLLGQSCLMQKNNEQNGPAQECFHEETAGEAVQVEYLVIDGNSRDKTVEVAESYRPLLENKGISFRVLSESDNGIYDAMNKGARLATGDVIAFLNSGDWYEEDTLKTIADVFSKQDCDLLFANIRIHKMNGSTIIKKACLRKYETSRDWNHPTTFVRAKLQKENPFLNQGIHDDYGFFLKMKKQGRKIITVDKVLANFQMGGASNQKSLCAAKKRIRDRYRYCYRVNGYSRWYLVECVVMEVGKWILG